MIKGLVSIIIPVYNAERYLAKCIESILRQTYEAFELVLVDDGARDGSGKICDDFSKKDNRLKVLHIENGGVSRARNIGIEHIRGEYVLFVDSDDYLEENMLEVLVDGIKKEESDLVICGFINENLNSSKEIFPKEKEGNYVVEQIATNILRDPYAYIYGVLWNKLFRTNIIKNHQLKFINNVTFGEDFIFNLSYLSQIQKVEVISKGLYHYIRYNNNSLMYKMVKQQIDSSYYIQSIDKRILIYEYYKKFYEDLLLYENYKNEINDYLFQYYISTNIELVFAGIERNEKKKCRAYLSNNTLIKECKKEMERRYYIKKSIKHFFSAMKGVLRNRLVKN